MSAEKPSLHPRTVIVIDRDLPKGLAANAAAVLALTLGARVPALPGVDFTDGAGRIHAGLITTGLPVLAAAAGELGRLRDMAIARGPHVVDLPAAGQQTPTMPSSAPRSAKPAGDAIACVAVLVSGSKRDVDSLTGQFGLLR